MLRGIKPKSGKVFDGSNLRTEWETACAAVGLGERVLVKTEHERNDREEPRIVRNKWYRYRGLIVHDLRRRGAKHLIAAGIDPHTAMAFSGHRMGSMLRRYHIISVGGSAAGE